ncbi:MAG: transglycosylase SLT domain-containing protein [Desulfovibrio sp.]|nr:transglycosylase SLT domain-containing protein [Desulfovibrio sp.]
MSRKRKAWRFSAVLCLICAMLAFGGCVGGNPSSTGTSMLVPLEPSGPPLTTKEIDALKTTGQLDRDLPPTAQADVIRQYRYFLRKGRGSMCVFVRRSEQYLNYARSVFRKRGMPEDLAYLAIVESGYKPEALSHAGAAGAWQFMPSTGKKYGLDQDKWTDERLDPYEATEAAASYLQKLYDDFGDWPTAIAAYNAGEGKMQRALEGSGSRNFFEVRERNETLPEKTRLREETKQYVPRFLAVTKIMRNLPQLGFGNIHPERAKRYVRLNARPATDLKGFSQALSLNWGDFSAYNAHHKGRVTSLYRTTFVYVPEGSDDKARVLLEGGSFCLNPSAVAALERGQDGGGAGRACALPQGRGRSHTLRQAETLYSVAARYNVSLEELKRANGIGDARRVASGRVLRIPGQTPGRDAGRFQKNSARRITYRVRENDSLYNIARRHQVSVEDLKRWNNVDEKRLKPGSTLVVNRD